MQDLLTPEERDALRSAVETGADGMRAGWAHSALEKAERAKSPEHEGYSSRETWGVGLVFSGSMDLSDTIDNRSAYYEALAMAATAAELGPEHRNVAEGIWTAEQATRYGLAEELKEYVRDNLPDLGGTLAADLIGCALCEVDWDQLAQHQLDALREEVSP